MGTIRFRFSYWLAVAAVMLFEITALADPRCKGDQIINGLPVANLGFGQVRNGRILGLEFFKNINSAVISQREITQKNIIVSMLQKFVTDQEFKSFRYLGNYYDFWHFHVLIQNGAPKALLYHTQENASENSNPSCKYTYIDAQARNWLQWFSEPDKIINAREFFNPQYSHEDSYQTHYTIHSENLEFFHENEKWKESQIGFFEVSCSQIPEKLQSEATNFFRLNTITGNRCFLLTGNSSCSSEWGVGATWCEKHYLFAQ